jgi:hypothetical protein
LACQIAEDATSKRIRLLEGRMREIAQALRSQLVASEHPIYSAAILDTCEQLVRQMELQAAGLALIAIPPPPSTTSASSSVGWKCPVCKEENRSEATQCSFCEFEPALEVARSGKAEKERLLEQEEQEEKELSISKPRPALHDAIAAPPLWPWTLCDGSVAHQDDMCQNDTYSDELLTAPPASLLALARCALQTLESTKVVLVEGLHVVHRLSGRTSISLCDAKQIWDSFHNHFHEIVRKVGTPLEGCPFLKLSHECNFQLGKKQFQAAAASLVLHIGPEHVHQARPHMLPPPTPELCKSRLCMFPACGQWNFCSIKLYFDGTLGQVPFPIAPPPSCEHYLSATRIPTFTGSGGETLHLWLDMPSNWHYVLSYIFCFL